MNASAPLKERLENKLEPIPEAGCWIFTGASVTGTGKRNLTYGVINEGVASKGAKQLRAHRAAWMVYRGPIPNGMNVLHRCDVPLCCNPDHLFLGTQTDNMQDCKAKERLNPTSGEKHGRANLDWEKVRRIRELYGNGLKTGAVAVMVGVSHQQISRIVLGQTWCEKFSP